MNRTCNLAVKLTTGLILGLQPNLVAAADPEQYLIGSGIPGSVPYSIGVGLSSLAQIVLLPEQNLNLSPTTSDGFDDSLRKLIDGTNQFAIVDSVSAHQSSADLDKEFEAVATLWHEVEHFVIANEYVQSGTISDLAILQSQDLATNLGNFEATRDLLSQFGVRLGDRPEAGTFDWETERSDFDRGATAGLAITGSVPSEVVIETLKQRGGQAQLLEFSHWQMAQIGKGWHAHRLEPDAYPGLAAEVDTVARTMMLVARRDVPEETVYQIVKMMFDNLPYLVTLDDAAAQISLDYALDEIDLPLHPGAVRYYREVGVLTEGSADAGATQLDAAMDHTGHDMAHAEHAGHGGGQHGSEPAEHVHDEAMLARARAEVHDGDVILKIGRPPVLRHPDTEISKVYFGLGKTELAEDGVADVLEVKRRIMEIYETFGREPEVYVEGHTDSVGSWETNYEIAYRRARAVSDILLAEGIPESWIHISDYSEQGLAVPTADGVAEERNRRVEITIIPQE
ncbi:MAG: TAXI family TRAP transporter solute-binding subunit [Geminicoccaceae bacterium]